MTREQFIAKYGDIDYVPEGANAKVIPYGPRKKREDEPPERARSKGKRR